MNRPLTTDEKPFFKPRKTPFVPQSPYGRPMTSSIKIDKSSIIWRDFLNGVKRRKRLLNHIRSVAIDENDLTSTLKRLLMEVRQITLKVIEDALEIEYRSQFGEVKAPIRAGTAMQLPPLSSFRGLEGKEDLYMLSDIVSDCDDLYKMPNIQAFLPLDFPHTRNPFILGKDVDALAVLDCPRPEAGNMAMELKALEFLRYKRAAKALLRAEAQVMNRMPLTLEDVEYLWQQLPKDRNASILVRSVITLLHEDNTHHSQRGPELRYLVDDAIYVDPPEFLRLLNKYEKGVVYSIDLLAAVRHVLKECSTKNFTDIASAYLTEWVRLIVGINCFKGEGPGMHPERAEQRSSSQSPKRKKRAQSTSPPKKGKSYKREESSDAESIGSTSKSTRRGKRNDEGGFGKKKSGMRASIDSQDSISVDDSTPQKKTSSKPSPEKKKKKKKETAAASSDPLKDLMKIGPKKSKKGRVDDEDVSMDQINALKYEIIKMQQELLKRKILDPKNFGVLPAKMYGPTVAAADEKDSSKSVGIGKNAAKKVDPMELMAKVEVEEAGEEPEFVMELRKSAERLNALVLLREPMPLRFSNGGFVEVLVDSNKSTIYTQYRRTIEKNEEEDDSYSDDGLEEPTKEQQIIVFNALNKLLFDRLTGLKIDPIVEMPEKLRANQLSGFLGTVQRHLDRLGKPDVLRQQLVYDIDMCVVSEVLSSGNIAVDVTIERVESSPGLAVRAIPRSGSLYSAERMDNTPITLFVHDRELMVLLINQRGLYTLALTKWSCLEMVARWLLGRIKINRIPFPIYKSQNKVGFDNTGRIADATEIDDNVTKTYFEVDIDRSVDLMPEVKDFWRARSVPTLNGVVVECDVTAHQDLEMLYITVDVELLFLHPSVIERRKKEKEIANAKRAKLIRFVTPYDDDHALDQEIENTWDIPFETDPEVERHHLKFSFGLTGDELLMFGCGESLDDKKIKSKDQGYQSNTFMKNVLGRLSLHFLGSKNQPHDEEKNCIAEENWELKYNRRLMRDVRTISGGVMVVIASGVGGEILFEATPTDSLLYGEVGPKLFSVSELDEIVLSEGWSTDLLEPSNRVNLAHRVLEKMKCVFDNERYRLEFYTFPETRLLEIVVQGTVNKSENSIGSVEIDSQLTLNDLRVVLNHELDRDLLPKLYRFMYKGAVCALKQEPFRKAWDCLPKCFLQSKTVREVTRSKDTTDKAQEAIDRAVAKARKAEEEAQKKSKAGKKLVPVPVQTLCLAQEGVWHILTRHDITGIIFPGDVLRIGHIESSDYIVPMTFSRTLELASAGAELPDGTINEAAKPVKTIPIDNYFLTYGESDLFITGNIPFSEVPVPTPRDEDIPEPEVYFDEEGNAVVVEAPKVDPETLIDPVFRYPAIESEESKEEEDTVPDMVAPSKQVSKSLTRSFSDMNMRNDEKEVIAASLRKEKDKAEAKARKEKSTNKRPPGKIFKDLWLWKCIPRSEDNRPRWRQQYDNGEISYTYLYRERPPVPNPTYFHVTVSLALMEEYCKDTRCQDMSPYTQRVNLVPQIAIDFYTEQMYDHLVTMAPPSTTKGIDEDKFMAIMKTLNIFPDMHKPQRQSQLSLAFFREVNGKEGDETYLNYYGFCNLIQEIALIRFPAGMFDLDGPEASHNNIYAAPGDGPPVPPAVDASDNASVDSSAADSTASGSLKRPALTKRAQVKTKKKTVTQNKKNKLLAMENSLLSQVDPAHAAIAYRKFVTDYFITVKKISDAVWEHAKSLAMDIEAVKYAAATRIMTVWRRGYHLSNYKTFRKGMVFLQSYIRMRQAIVRIRNLLRLYTEDWLFRLRYHAAILAQSSVRRYLCRCWYIKTMTKIRDREIVVAKARRQRQSKLRKRERKGIVFKQIRRINGIMVMLILRRKDQRNYSNDYGMKLEVYNPDFQAISVFIIEEVDLRKYMQEILQVDALSIGDLLNKNNLEKVISVRLLCRRSKRVGDAPKLILSRQALGQKGPKIMTRGRNIKGELFMCSLYETGYDIVVQCYHQRTSKIFPCTILHSAMTEWVTKEYIKTCSSDIEKQLQPPLLRSENRNQLHHWLINNIVVDKRYGKFQVMFAFQLRKGVKMDSIIKIQSVFRMCIQRMKIPKIVDSYSLKVNSDSFESSHPYYLNIYTGESSWYKPSLLKEHQDLPTQPMYKWVQLPYSVDPLYVNPLTGKYTHYTTDGAARIIQSLVRNWLMKPFRLPKDKFIRAATFEREVQSCYEREPRRLAFILNYALIAFCVRLDYRLARQLILEALDLADTNPLTTRLHAVFLISTCEAPLAVNRAHADSLLQDAARRDPEGLKFRTALNLFFKYGCYRQPRNARTLLHLGLAEYYVYKNMVNAEVCLRRAVSLAPFDSCVMENWKRLRDDFPEKKLVYRPRGRLEKINAEVGGKRTTIHGRPVVENPEWAGWVFVETDPMFKDNDAEEYWYNPATGESQPFIPENWHRQWELRVLRSVFEGEVNGLEHYFDPATSTYFHRHVLTDTYQS